MFAVENYFFIFICFVIIASLLISLYVCYC